MEENPGRSCPVTGDARGIVNLFGKYEVGKLLGCGAFAKVYRARDIRTGQSVAIKAVSKQKVLKGGFMGHVMREISILRRLRHPHIVKIFEVLATKSNIYFVLEFAKCGELFSRVARGGRLSEDLSRRYFQQLISAVGFCHARGVFHRDLKPENLLLDENSDLKVSDFGLSAVQEQVRPEGLLYTVCGTPAYVAPEILAKKGYVGARVDVWSCGIILFVLVAGYLPFNDTNLIKMYRKIYTGKFRCPIWTSPELRRLLSRLLDTNPETRITIDEILRDPWFRKDYRDINSHLEDIDLKNHHETGNFLNAFGIISFSSGFDLSGLFDDSDISVSGERFVSAESSEHIIERVAEVAMAENVIVKKKEDWGAKLEGRNGNFAMILQIYRLNDELVLVEVKQKEICVGLELVQEIWKHKLRPKLDGLIYQLKTPVVSDE